MAISMMRWPSACSSPVVSVSSPAINISLLLLLLWLPRVKRNQRHFPHQQPDCIKAHTINSNTRSRSASNSTRNGKHEFGYFSLPSASGERKTLVNLGAAAGGGGPGAGGPGGGGGGS